MISTPIQSVPCGVWGYGITGAAFVRWLIHSGAQHIHLYNQSALSAETRDWCNEHGVTVHEPEQLATFLAQTELLLPSPGVNVRAHAHTHTIIPELTLFRNAWHGPIVGITGTLGKTTVTTLLSHALKQVYPATITAGNIGTPMLDYITNSDTHAPAVLELSSFQLEHEQASAPDLAIITNIYPNHLDRHGSLEAYRTAKYKCLIYQSAHQKALLPLDLIDSVPRTAATRAWFTTQAEHPQLSRISPAEPVYLLHANTVIKIQHGRTTELCPLPSHTTFAENWLIVHAALDILAIDKEQIAWQEIVLPDHRLACLGTWKQITFYDDSKSTVPQATIAALQHLSNQPVVLFLGGVSKGVDRKELCSQVKQSARHIICFGSEAQQLANWCAEQHIPTHAYTTLEEAFEAYVHIHAQPHDQVLFSPSGASFDLFAHYQARGKRFQELVLSWARQLTT